MNGRDDTFTNLRLFKSLISLEDMFNNIMSSGAMGAMCLACSILTFLFLMFCILMKAKEGNISTKSVLPDIIKAFIIIALFGNIIVYKGFAGLIYNMTEIINSIFSLELVKIKTHIEFLYHEMLNKRLEKINIINPFTWIATIDILVSSMFLYFFLNLF